MSISTLILVALVVGLTVVTPRADQVDNKKWDVGADLGPTTKLAFETSEGTWMNVDVSPDGQRIVFDLLGDIYMMPIGGSGNSPATRLTSGPAFDMQPRFSPDGKRIAIASDRDGLWNIWTIDADGRNPKQLSRDRRWFVNSPAWSAEGSYVFARRHFVAQRSLGAGEIWMYHAAGSDGLQVTEKNGRAVPAHRPDGRSVTDHGGLPDVAHLTGCRIEPSLVRRQPHRSLVARAGAVHAQSRTDVHVHRSEPLEGRRAGSEGA